MSDYGGGDDDYDRGWVKHHDLRAPEKLKIFEHTAQIYEGRS